MPEFSRLHPVIPQLYVQEWKTDMKNRNHITQVTYSAVEIKVHVLVYIATRQCRLIVACLSLSVPVYIFVVLLLIMPLLLLLGSACLHLTPLLYLASATCILVKERERGTVPHIIYEPNHKLEKKNDLVWKYAVTDCTHACGLLE